MSKRKGASRDRLPSRRGRASIHNDNDDLSVLTEKTSSPAATRKKHSSSEESSGDDVATSMAPPSTQRNTLIGELMASGQKSLLAYAKLATKERPHSATGQSKTSAATAKAAPKFKEEDPKNTTSMILENAAKNGTLSRQKQKEADSAGVTVEDYNALMNIYWNKRKMVSKFWEMKRKNGQPRWIEHREIEKAKHSELYMRVRYGGCKIPRTKLVNTEKRVQISKSVDGKTTNYHLAACLMMHKLNWKPKSVSKDTLHLRREVDHLCHFPSCVAVDVPGKPGNHCVFSSTHENHSRKLCNLEKWRICQCGPVKCHDLLFFLTEDYFKYAMRMETFKPKFVQWTGMRNMFMAKFNHYKHKWDKPGTPHWGLCKGKMPKWLIEMTKDPLQGEAVEDVADPFDGLMEADANDFMPPLEQDE